VPRVNGIQNRNRDVRFRSIASRESAAGNGNHRICTGSCFARAGGVIHKALALTAMTGALLLTACGPAARMLADLRELQDVGRSVAAVARTPDVSVNLVNGHVLQIGVPTRPTGAANSYPIRDIAAAAFRAYPSRSQLNSVVVLTFDQRTYFGFFPYTVKNEAGRYRPYDLQQSPLLVERWAAPRPPNHLYLVAVGDADRELLDWLAEHVRQRFGVETEQLSPIPFDRATYDRERSQVIAEGLVSAIRNRYPAVWRDVTARVIGITSNDMFLRSHHWTLGFSWRSEDGRMAAVSYRRMDPTAFGLAPDADLLRARLAKMVGKDVGVLCFGLPLSDNPRSVMYGRIGGTDELDVMTEFVDPQ